MSRRTVTRPEVWLDGWHLSSIAPSGWGGLQHSTRGQGDWQLSFTLDVDGRLGHWRHPAIRYGAPVELRFGPLCLWAGSLTEPDWDAGQMVALGASRDAENAIALDGSGMASTKPNTVVDAAITRGVVSWIRAGDFGTTAVGQADDDGGLVKLYSVLDAWASETGNRWYVDPHRRLRIATAGQTEPKWYVVPGSGVLGSADDDRVDRVFVRYISTTGGVLATASYPAATPAGGVESAVDITDRGAMNATRAGDIAQGIWSDLRGQSGWTNGLTLSRGQITTAGGADADPAMIRAGDTIRLLGVPDPRGLAHNLDVEIGETDYDWTEDSIQINPVGLVARDDASLFEQIGELTAANWTTAAS